jgi:Tfp pilus assembly protein PilN
MIEINLLPNELKVKLKKKKNFTEEMMKRKELFLYLIPLLLGILLIMHIFLGITAIAKSGNYKGLKRKWQALEPQRKALEAFNKEHGILTEDAKMVKQYVDSRVTWSEKFNKLSAHLPSGMWFRQLNAEGKNFVLFGSVISLQKEEMALLKEFIDSLKGDSGFFKDFASLELTSVQTKPVGAYEVVDFTLQGALK